MTKDGTKEELIRALTESFHQYIDPDMKKNPWQDDLFDLPQFTAHPEGDRTTLLSSPTGPPDAIVSGYIDFKTSTSEGLGLEHPDVTIRLDIRELLMYLAIPRSLTRGTGEEEIGYQNVSAEGTEGQLIDIYERNLVLAFPCRDLKVPRTTHMIFGDPMMITQLGITFPEYIAAQYGLSMQYTPVISTSWEEQLASLLIQLSAVALDFIPGVGPILAFCVYTAGNAVLDATWITKYDSVAPPTVAWILAERGNIKKYMAPKIPARLRFK
jgi:hypothetical protein